MRKQSTLGHPDNQPPATIQNSDPPCGVVAHPDDCLCDVNVVSPVEIANNIDPERFWGMEIALDGGHSYESDEDIVNLLEALALAKDAVANMEGFDRYDAKGKLRASKDLKEQICVFLKDGNSIVDAPRQFKTSWANCLAAITQGVPSAVWGWPERFWAQIEDFIMEQDEWCGYRALMRKFDIERGSAVTLERLYREATYAESAAALAYARELYLRSPRAKTPWMMKKLEQRGHTLTDNQLHQLRARLRQAGLTPDTTITVDQWRKNQR